MDRLLDEAAVERVVVGLARAQDDRDWPTFERSFTERVVMGVPSIPVPTEMATRDYLPSARRALEGFDVTHHQLGSVIVAVDGNRAEAVADVRALHLLIEADVTSTLLVGGRYRFVLQRTTEGWRIRERILHVRYTVGDPSVAARAHARYDARR